MQLYKGFKTRLVAGGLAFIPGAAMAQTLVVPEGATAVVDHHAPELLVPILAGIVLAFGFQMLLSFVSLAGGLSFTPNLMKSSAKHKAERLKAGHPLHMGDELTDEEHAHHHASSVTIVNEVGVWALATSCTALFLATWLSVRLGYIAAMEDRYVMALVIWAAFLMLITWLEWRSAKSMVGGIIGIAVAGLGTGSAALKALLTKSPAQQLEDFGKHTVHDIFAELSHAAKHDKVHKKVAKYLSDLKPSGLDYDRIHDDIADLVKKAGSNMGESDIVQMLTKKMDQNHRIVTKANIGKLVSTVTKAVQTAQTEPGSMSDKVMAFGQVIAPLPDDQAKALREKFEQFLSKSGRSELDPQEIRKDIEAMVADPGAAVDTIKARLAHLDRGTVKAMLTQNAGIDEGKADKIIEGVLGAIESMKGKYGDAMSAATDKAKSLQSGAKDMSSSAQDKISGYLDSLNIPSLNMDSIKGDIEDLLHDPMSAPQVLKDRLGSLDSQSLMTILKSNPWISQEQIQGVVDNVTSTRDDVLKTVATLEDKAVAMAENIRRRTAIAAEHARKAAIAASWWTVGMGFASGAAALLGAYFSAYPL